MAPLAQAARDVGVVPPLGALPPECARVQQELVIAEGQLHDYQARLGMPFGHEADKFTLPFGAPAALRVAEGRAFRYAPRFTREELQREVAGNVFRQMLDSSPESSLPLSYLVEILTERDAHLLDDLQNLVEAKRRQLRGHDPSKKEHE